MNSFKLRGYIRVALPYAVCWMLIHPLTKLHPNDVKEDVAKSIGDIRNISAELLIAWGETMISGLHAVLTTI